jgi:hypothetical protein
MITETNKRNGNYDPRILFSIKRVQYKFTQRTLKLAGRPLI